MVYTHVLQFFSEPEFFPSIEISIHFFNLITFSGFIFCFGYVNQLAYYRKPFKRVYLKMLLTGIKTLLAFYVSGLTFQIFVADQSLIAETVIDILLLEVIPGWSEFLLSFSFILLFGLLLFPIVKWLIERPIYFLVLTVLLLSTTWIDYSQVTIPQLGLIIGTEMFPTFPVFQYLSFYLIGIYFARYKVVFKWKVLVISLMGTVAFITYMILHSFQLPERFPPTIYWVVGPTFILYGYYLFTNLLNLKFAEIKWLRVMGENALFFLVLSNVFIFALDSKLTLWVIGPWKSFIFTIMLLLIIFYLLDITKKSTPKEISLGGKENES